MESITFNCEIVTPMFLSGADGEAPELRAPSIKGMMRFWWRAVKAKNDITKLKEEEAEIFGGSGEKQGRSSVILQVREIGKGNKSDISYDEGIKYLQYSIRKRESLHPEFKFKIILRSHNIDALKQAAASLWCAANLGGLGSRSRRGGGNINITNVNDSTDVLNNMRDIFIPKGNSSDEISDWLINSFCTIKGIIRNDKKDKSDFAYAYSNLSFSRFIISDKPFRDWKAALDDTGRIFKGYRDSKKSEIFDSAIFGLPVRHKNGTQVDGKINNNKTDRRSSPLIFKVLKVNDKYYWLALRLAGEFLPEGGVIKAYNKKEKTTNTQKPDYVLLDDFWNKLKSKGKEKILSKPDTLNSRIEKIKNTLDPKSIILFGSKASGNFHKRSDIDFAVDTDKRIEDGIFNGAVDIVNVKTCGEELKKKIEKEGVTVYEREG